MRLVFLILLSTLTAGLCAQAVAQAPKTDQAIADTIWNPTRTSAVVKIVTDCGENSKPSGSGFIVGNRYVFTARHVVLACAQDGQTFNRRYSEAELDTLKKNSDSATHSVQITAGSGRTWNSPFIEMEISRDSDFALIDLGAQQDSPPGLCLATKQGFEPSALATLYGYGLGNPPAVRFGRVDNPETDEHFSQLNLTAGPGWSGAPVTNARGYVVGVEVGGNPGANLALPLFRVRSLLLDLNVIPPVGAQESLLTEHEDQAICPDPNGRLLGYEHTERLSRIHFGPVGGGFDPMKACGSIIGNLVAKYPSGAVLTPTPLPEHQWFEGFRESKYEYWCDVKVEWGPIYESTRHAACGPRDLKTDPVHCLN